MYPNAEGGGEEPLPVQPSVRSGRDNSSRSHATSSSVHVWQSNMLDDARLSRMRRDLGGSTAKNHGAECRNNHDMNVT